VGSCRALAALIGVDQELFGFDRRYSRARLRAIDTKVASKVAAAQIDTDRQVPPACCGADLGGDTRPTAVGCCWAGCLGSGKA
jgi:hypothetical protein